MMSDPVPYNLLLGRACMHQVKAKGDYGNNTYTILDVAGLWKPILEVDVTGKVAAENGPLVVQSGTSVLRHQQQSSEMVTDSDTESEITRDTNPEVRAIVGDDNTEDESSDDEKHYGSSSYVVSGKVVRL